MNGRTKRMLALVFLFVLALFYYGQTHMLFSAITPGGGTPQYPHTDEPIETKNDAPYVAIGIVMIVIMVLEVRSIINNRYRR